MKKIMIFAILLISSFGVLYAIETTPENIKKVVVRSSGLHIIKLTGGSNTGLIRCDTGDPTDRGILDNSDIDTNKAMLSAAFGALYTEKEVILQVAAGECINNKPKIVGIEVLN
jgi:hypothetical protein